MYDNESLKIALAIAPDELKNYLGTPDLTREFKSIASQIQEVEIFDRLNYEITAVLVGLNHIDQFKANIFSGEYLTLNQAQWVVDHVTKSIFNPAQKMIDNTYVNLRKPRDMSNTDDVNGMVVPLPPKFVSPKVQEASQRIAAIRPKPHQGTGDPYRELPN